MPGSPALFLDRDGTINREVDYLADPALFELLPGVASAIASARSAGYKIIVITNQSGIARGLLSEQTLAAIHQRMDSDLAAAGTHVDGYYFCPHHPTEVAAGNERYRQDCPCRKPKPGMLEQAIAEHNLDAASSHAIGDSLRDLDSARTAGVPSRYLVGTGKGTSQRPKLKDDDHFARDLPSAIAAII